MEHMRRVSDDGVVSPGTDLIKWWPITLIAVAVVAMRFPGSAAWVGSWIWASVGLGLSVLLVRGRRDKVLSPAMALFGGFVGYSALSLLWSPNTGRGLRFVALIGVAFLAYIYGRTVGPPRGGSEMGRAGSIGLAVAVAGLLIVRHPGSVGHLNPNRILAMGIIALVVTAWYGPRGRLYTLGLGAIGLGAVLLSGSRTASLVMIVLLLTAPRLRLPATGRWLLSAFVLALVLLLAATPVFQERWFQSGEGNMWDLVTLQGVNTSGRTQIWPVIANSCRNIMLGEGVGASDSFAFEAHTGFPEPHNEYLRLWCDTGLVGSVLFWGFVFLVGMRGVAGLRRSKSSWPHSVALQMAGALLLLSMTDNPLTTAVPFMVPAALAFGWSEHHHESDRGHSDRALAP